MSEMQIGKFQVVGNLGSGAHSKILHIRRAADGKNYALKVVPIDGPEEQKFLEQAQHEFRVGQMLDYPSLIKVHALETVKDWRFRVRKVHLLIEYVNGKTLDVCPRIPMPMLVQVFERVADGMVHMHRRGVYHSDLKPNNMLLSKSGDVKVIDFGLARIKDEIKDRVQGTPEYIAPETAKHKMVNERTDIYNFGATMYRMLTFRLPPCVVSAEDGGLPIGAKIWHKLFKPVDEYNAQVPSPLCDLVHRCLSYEAVKRPERMSEVQGALDHLVETLVKKPEDRLEALEWCDQEVFAVAEYLDREHFIPLRKHDLMQLLLRDKQLPAEEREPFRRFGRLVSAAFHFEYLARLEEMKDAYASFDPDADTKPCEPLFPEERKGREDKVFAAFAALMARADFKPLNKEEIHRAVQQTPDDWGLNMDLDLNVFERLEIYERGEVIGSQIRRSWRRLWRREKIKVPLYQRLAVILKLKAHRRVDPSLDVNLVYFKLFKDVPRADVDMTLPGGRPRIRPIDRAMIAWPLAVGLVLLVYHFTQVLPRFDLNALVSLASLSLAAAFCGYAYRSFHNYLAKRQTYILQLVRSLYFKALDSNNGVLMRLLNEAEEQQCRETYLAYFCLWRFAPPQGWTSEQLDDYVEMYLEGAACLKVDFEVGAALIKLEQLHIVQKDGDHYRPLPLEQAVEKLKERWDNYFKRSNPEPATPGC